MGEGGKIQAGKRLEGKCPGGRQVTPIVIAYINTLLSANNSVLIEVLVERHL